MTGGDAYLLSPGQQMHFVLSIPELVRGKLTITLEQRGGQAMLLLRHGAVPRVSDWEQRRFALLRVEADGLLKVQSALSLMASYQGLPLALRVLQLSPTLLGLAADSRSFDFSSPPPPTPLAKAAE